MAIGPFNSFVFPGVYTQTFNEPPRVGAAGDIRFPAFIGVADEIFPVNAYEMIRGSSSMSDNKITDEDVSLQADGTNRAFQVTFYPITTGGGAGVTTTNILDVIVTVNGDSAPVASVDGTNGLVYLMIAPQAGDTVKVTYFFKRKDTYYPSEDHSDEANGANKIFKVDNVPIVNGNGGGVTTTTPSDVVVTVNGIAATVSAVDGADGLITLSTAPTLGQTVLISYYSNNYQDTYDVLPSNQIVAIEKIGYNSTSTDFINTVDYVLDTTGQFATVNWGNSAKLSTGTHTTGATLFTDKISTTLYDNHNFRRLATGTSDGTNVSFKLDAVPTQGTGLGKGTDDPSNVTAYVGADPTAATLAVVTEVSAANQTVKLLVPPAAGQKVYVTQYQNMLPDDSWTLVNTVEGATGDGTYTMSGVSSGIAYDITQLSAPDTTVADPDFGTENVTYPAGTGAGNRDTQVIPGYGISEKITLNFIDSTRYVVTSDMPAGTGSAGDNTGYLSQTYVDKKTGFRVTINPGVTVVYQNGDKIAYRSSPTLVTSLIPTRAIPGVKVTVTDTLTVPVNDTAIINTYNKSGAEPNIGDFYYVTYLQSKEFNSSGFNSSGAAFVTLEKDALAFTGTLSASNKLALAAHLAFLNGAPAMALVQIKKTTGGTDAPDSEYIAAIDSFNEPMVNGLRPSLMEPVTTSHGVLSYLKTSNTIQSSMRYANERMTYFGFANNTSPSSAMVYAQAMNNERMTGIYPDGAMVTLTDALGNSYDILVDGSLLAAALSGRDTSPAFDVAEPLTRKPIVGFSRLFRRMDSVTQAQVANSGLTLFEETPAGIDIKMDLTTDLSSVLTRTPSVIKIKDFVQKGTRSVLDAYIGQKFLPSKTSEIENTLTSYLDSLTRAQIITSYTGVKATPDPNEPTTVNVVAYYSPVLPLLWIMVTFNLRSSV